MTVSALEDKGYTLRGVKLFPGDNRDRLQTQYKDKLDRPSVPSMIDRLSKGMLCAMVWEGRYILQTVQKLIDHTGQRIGSMDKDTANRDISIWFDSSELFSSDNCKRSWVYE